MKYIDTTNGITVYIDGRPQTIRDDSPNFAMIVDAVERGDEDEVRALLNDGVVGVAIKKTNGGGDFEIDDNTVKWKGVTLHGALVDKILSLVQKGAKTLDNYVLFLENLMQNPSMASVEELYDFLSYKELPITEDGCFLAYKGVSTDYYSCSGNKKTVVLSGTVDDQGRILNKVGEVIEVARNQVDDDRNRGCSFGLHAGSWDYAHGFGSITFAVKINPKDVVSVPKDCACQKVRVCRYEVIEEISEEVVSAAVTTTENKVESADTKDNAKLVCRILGYLARKGNATLRQVQSSLAGYANVACREIEKIVKDNGGKIEYGKSLSKSVASYSE